MGTCNIFKGTNGINGWYLPAANETIVTCTFSEPLQSPFALPTLEQSLQESTKGTFELLEIMAYWGKADNEQISIPSVGKVSVRIKGNLSKKDFSKFKKELKHSYECAKAEDFEEGLLVN